MRIPASHSATKQSLVGSATNGLNAFGLDSRTRVLRISVRGRRAIRQDKNEYSRSKSSGGGVDRAVKRHGQRTMCKVQNNIILFRVTISDYDVVTGEIHERCAVTVRPK